MQVEGALLLSLTLRLHYGVPLLDEARRAVVTGEMGGVRTYIQKLMDCGVQHATTDRRRYQTRASNLVAVAFSLMSLPYVPLEYLLGAPHAALLTGTSCFVYPITLLLNDAGHSRSARALPLMMGSVMGWLFAGIMSPESQVQLVLFMVGLWAFTLYDAREEWPQLLGLQALPALTFMAVNSGWIVTLPGWKPTSALVEIYAQVMPVTTFVLSSAFLFVFYLRNQTNEDRLIASLKTVDEARQQALAGEKAKAEFLAVMSHEIRTPLNGVLGCAELMRGEPLSNEQQHWLRTLTSSGEHLLDLMTTILEYSRLDAGKAEVHNSQVDIVSLLDDTTETFAGAAEAKGLDLWFTSASNIPESALLDPGRLRLTVSCLISNAVKYTTKGHIAVHLSCTPLDAATTQLQVSVSDTGRGIAPELHEVIFERFRQVDDFGRRREGGVGLGLSICRTNAKLMGGQIHVESAVDRGSCFTLTLVSKTLASLLPAAIPHDSVLQLLAKRVRVVAYTPELSAALRNKLRRFKQALEEENERPTDVLLLDERLAPDAEALERLRRPDEVVVLLSNTKRNIAAASVRHFLRREDWFDALTVAFGLPPVSQRVWQVRAQEAVWSRGARPPKEVGHSVPGAAAFAELPRSQANPAGQLADEASAARTTAGSDLSTEPTSGARATLAARQDNRDASSTERAGGPDSSLAHVTPPASAASGKVAHTILIADDQVTNQQVLRKLAERLGEQVIVVENGLLAVEAWAAHTPDVILMDIQMPVMDGLEATRTIRAREGTDCRTPIIAVTANALPEQRAEGLLAGLDEYLTKPIRAAELRAAIERYCGIASGRQPNVPDSATTAKGADVGTTKVSS